LRSRVCAWARAGDGRRRCFEIELASALHGTRSRDDSGARRLANQIQERSRQLKVRQVIERERQLDTIRAHYGLLERCSRIVDENVQAIMLRLERFRSAPDVGHAREVANEGLDVLIATGVLELCQHLRRFFYVATDDCEVRSSLGKLGCRGLPN